MHQIGVVGLSYRHVGVEDVARFALPRAEVPTRLPGLRTGLRAVELVYVGTCNRVEVVFAVDDASAAPDMRREVFRALTGREPAAGEAARMLRAWTGEAAVEHLFLLACGLDSAQTGEHEIAAQLRGAWEESRAARTCGPVLDRLVGEALGMARRVRRLTAGVRTPSLGDLAADRVLQHLGGRQGRVALIGVSPMTRRCAAVLHESGVPLLIVNRTLQAAEELAVTVGGEALALERFRAAPPALYAVVLAAGGGEPVLDAQSLTALKSGATPAPLLIDFGVPPNVDPEVARRAGLARVGMSDLIEAAQGRRLAELVRLAPVRAAIDERLGRLRGELATRAIGSRLADLRGAFEQIAAAEVARALKQELRTLDDRQREQLERLASTVAHRLAHLPLAGLRAAAVHASPDAVDAFFEAAKASRAPAAVAAVPLAAPPAAGPVLEIAPASTMNAAEPKS
jgi:glutamyl-tRNA reductase